LRIADFDECLLFEARRLVVLVPRDVFRAADLADFFAPRALAADRRLPLDEALLLLEVFRPRETEDLLRPAELRRPPLFLLDDFLAAIPVARLAAPVARLAAFFTVTFAVATFFGLLAAVPAIAPSTPPITVPTGPATLPTTAPVAAPAVVLEIGGTSIMPEDEDWFSDDCWSCSSGIGLFEGWLLLLF